MPNINTLTLTPLRRLIVSRLTRSAMILLSAMSLWAPISAQAQFKEEPEIKVTDFDWRDSRQHQRQADEISEMVRVQYGERIRQSRSDLPLLQRIIDAELIKPDDRMGLQSLGVVLGNALIGDTGYLEWKIYQDKAGRSRALCVPDSQYCLFPITMLSRRIEVGLSPNVNDIFEESLELIDPYRPLLPYEVR